MTAREGDPIGEVSTTATLGALVVRGPAVPWRQASRSGFAGGYTSRDDLPACCRGWLGEQTHRDYQRARRCKQRS